MLSFWLVVYLEPRVYWKQPLYLAYTLASLDATLWNYTQYVVVIFSYKFCDLIIGNYFLGSMTYGTVNILMSI